MQLEAFYNEGKLEFKVPVKFKHNNFTVMVNVPEAEIDNGVDKSTAKSSVSIANGNQANALIERIQAILGSYFDKSAESSVSQDKETFLNALNEKYLK